MQSSAILRRCLSAVASAVFAFGVLSLQAQTASSAQTRILMPEDLSRIMPGTVFFRGQTASVQLRNSYGLRFADGAMMLAALVDSSGYSSGIKEKYQGYLLSEIPLTIEGRTLLPGAYGFGVLANNTFVVMDLGAHDILQVPSRVDATMARPRPLAIVAGPEPASYRMYEGKKFVTIRAKP